MKVFISWSGALSRAVAEVLRDWLSCVLQASKPWFSDLDMDRGSVWFQEISDQLKDAKVGIICLTHENKDRPWILFEAGALAKGLTSSRVCTLLIDLAWTDVVDPLAQFNHTRPLLEDMRKLVHTLNNQLANPLEQRVLDNAFSTYWEQFERGFSKAVGEHPPAERREPRSSQDMILEILQTVRGLQRDVETLKLNENEEAPILPTLPIGEDSARILAEFANPFLEYERTRALRARKQRGPGETSKPAAT